MGRPGLENPPLPPFIKGGRMGSQGEVFVFPPSPRRALRGRFFVSASFVYRWFTEGFDTADLQEARALLEELEG